MQSSRKARFTSCHILATFGLACCLAPLIAYAAPARIDRLDLFDRQDNQLLFVTFQYDGTGKNTARTVYAADSTFLRNVALENDAGGNRTKEQSIDFLGYPTWYTTYAGTPATTTTFHLFDQFGLSYFGSPVSYGQPVSNVYDISQNGSVIYRMRYEYDGNGSLMKISVIDKSNTLLYYALTNTVGIGTAFPPSAPDVTGTTVTTLSSGACRVGLTLGHSSVVSARLYSPEGRQVYGETKRLGAGRQFLTVGAGKGRAVATAGVQFIDVRVDGVTVVRGMRVAGR